MTALRQSRQFEADFTARALYLSEANPSAARRFIDAVEAALDLLARHPAMGPVWRYGDPQRPTRYLLVPGFRNYLIFYRYEGGEVALGRLMHGAQDLHDVLGD